MHYGTVNWSLNVEGKIPYIYAKYVYCLNDESMP